MGTNITGIGIANAIGFNRNNKGSIKIPTAIKDSMVLWYDIAKQKATNESMSLSPILKDLSGNGHDLACHNFAWSGMSGIGGYAFDIPDPSKGRFEYTKIGDSKFVFHKNIGVGTYLFTPFSNYINSPQKIRVTNLPNGSTIRFYYNSTQFGEKITQDGEYAIPLDTIEEGTVIIGYSGITPTTNIEGFTFEFLPEYPNALVSDGVDDYGMCEGLPLLTDYTVIAKRKYISEKNGSLAIKRGVALYREFNMENRYNDTYTRTQSFISWNTLPDGFASQDVTCQTRLSYNGAPIVGINGDTDGDTDWNSLILAKGINAALYSFLLFSRTLSEEEIEWVKENMVNGYPSPVVHYDCSKYTNADMGDNPVLEDLSGNGHDLELHNFAFAGMSGFDGFPIALKSTFPRDFTEDSQYESTQEYIQINSLRAGSGLLQVRRINSIEDYIEIPSFRIKVSGVSEAEETYPGLTFRNNYHYVDADGTHKTIDVSNDGEHVLPKSTIPAEKVTGWPGFVESHNFNVIPENGTISVSIRIELIPEYPGGLVFDGVDDFAEIANSDKYKFKTVFLLLELIDYNSDEEWTFLYDGRPSAHVMAAGINASSVWVQWNDGGKTYINGIHNTKVATPDMIGKRTLVTIMNDRKDVDWTAIKFMSTIGASRSHNTNANIALWKFLGFKEALTEEQIRQVIQDYQLMDDVDDVWNEQQ